MRQKNDAVWSKMLERIRLAAHTENDIKCLKQCTKIKLENDIFKNAIRIFLK